MRCSNTLRLTACLALLGPLLPAAALEFNSPTYDGAADMAQRGSFNRSYDGKVYKNKPGAAPEDVKKGAPGDGDEDEEEPVTCPTCGAKLKPGQKPALKGPATKEVKPSKEKSEEEEGFLSKVAHHPATWIGGGALLGAIIGFMLGGPVGAILGGLLGAGAGYLGHKHFIED